MANHCPVLNSLLRPARVPARLSLLGPGFDSRQIRKYCLQPCPKQNGTSVISQTACLALGQGEEKIASYSSYMITNDHAYNMSFQSGHHRHLALKQHDSFTKEEEGKFPFLNATTNSAIRRLAAGIGLDCFFPLQLKILIKKGPTHDFIKQQWRHRVRTSLQKIVCGESNGIGKNSKPL